MPFRQLRLREVSPLPTRALLHALFEAPARPLAPKEVRLVRDEELSPRQNLIFLLQTAAEIEHSLLIEYLYAAYSLKPGLAIPGAPSAGLTTDDWKDAILNIAKEEMGHLLSVQNVLRYVGGPLHFDRKHLPYRSQLYPFPFVLRPLTKRSLAKYVFAEMPQQVPAAIVPEAQQAIIRKLALEDAGGVGVNHVGVLYDSIIQELGAFQDSDFTTDTGPWQAVHTEWGHGTNDSHAAPLTGVKVYSVDSVASATAALQSIAQQGEGAGDTADPAVVANAHYKRFYDIYAAFPDSDFTPSLPVPTNPNTTDPLRPADAAESWREDELAPGRITNSVTQHWAHLFNIRYRMLLSELTHLLSIPAATLNGKAVTAVTAGATPTPRATLIKWAYADMHSPIVSLASLAEILTHLDRTDVAAAGKAGPPFELPYTLEMPDRARDRWQVHTELITAFALVIDKLDPPPGADQQLQQMKAADAQRMQVIAQNLDGGF
jgi:Ferritin-like